MIGRRTTFDLAVVLAVLMTACGVAPHSQVEPSPSRGASAIVRYKIPTSDHVGPSMLAAWGGYLQGRINNDGTACLWLGSGKNQTVLIWPPGYSAAGAPLSVIDDHNRRVAMVGKYVQVGGGLVSPLPVPVPSCSVFDRAWAVGSVSSK
jgi:hypothetical protein